jgi:hypothetical protein
MHSLAVTTLQATAEVLHFAQDDKGGKTFDTVN